MPGWSGNGCPSPSFCSENIVQDGGKEDAVVEGGLCLGPWLVAVH